MGQPLIGTSDNQNSAETPAVSGISETYNGVRGTTSAEFHGAVVGISLNHSQNPGPGVYGDSDGPGVWGNSKKWHGVAGISDSTTGGAGVYGKGNKGIGVLGEGETWHGVAGVSKSTTGGAGIYGKGKIAGSFEGEMKIVGEVNIVGGNLNIQGGLLQMNGVGIWSLIQELQAKIAVLEKKVQVAQRTADSALSTANSAMTTAQYAANKPR